MAVHNGFDNRFYVNILERKQDRLCKLNFEVWSYFNYVLLIFIYWQRYLSIGELARLLINEVVMPIWNLSIVAIDER